jgi:hypothetical protein
MRRTWSTAGETGFGGGGGGGGEGGEIGAPGSIFIFAPSPPNVIVIEAFELLDAE